MSAPSGGGDVPRRMLLAAGALVLFSLGAVTTARLTALEPEAAAPLAAWGERHIQFQDLDDGGLRVVDVDQARTVATLRAGEGGFVRGLVRALVRERRLHGASERTPFLLGYAADGSLVLEDPATRSRIALNAFGPSNVAAVAAWLGTSPAGTSNGATR